MNWEAIGAIGEIIGAAAVVGSLVYLAVQIRHNSQLLKRTATADTVSALRDFSALMLAHSELPLIYQKGVEGMENLNMEEWGQFVLLVFNFMKAMEDLHYQHINGAMDPEVWSGWESLGRGYITSPGFQEYWAERRSIFGPRFQEWVDSLSPLDRFARTAAEFGRSPPETGRKR